MISKKVLSDIISKYSLGGSVEKVKWDIKTKGGISINFINDSKNLVGSVTYNPDFGLKEGKYGIFNTSQLIKCLNILDGDILVDTTKSDGLASKLNIADTNYDIKFNLADPAVIPKTPEVNTPGEPVAYFKVSDEFITRFVKSKDALSELDTFTVETNDGFTGKELTFTVGTDITNTIQFSVEEATIQENFEPIPFDSNLFKEILKANRDYYTGKIVIYKAGLIGCTFCMDKNKDLYTTYHLVRRQKNN